MEKERLSSHFNSSPSELAHLTGLSPAEVNRQRFSISRSFAAQHGCYLILKGPHTIVTTPEGRQYVNDSGNPSLAKGGTGDVLTGMILSFVMSHSAIQEALSNAVFLHGKAADMLVDDVSSPHSVVAGDVVQQLPLTFRSILHS